MTTTTNVHVNVSGATMADVVATIIDVADTSTLITALSKRLEAQGRMLMIHEVAEGDGGTKADAPPTMKPAAKKTEPKPAAKKTEPKPEPKPEVDTGGEAGSAEDWGSGAEPEKKSEPAPSKYTVADVREALDKHRATLGLVTVRQIMAEVGGSSKLVEIAPEKYGAVLAALATHAKKAAA